MLFNKLDDALSLGMAQFPQNPTCAGLSETLLVLHRSRAGLQEHLRKPRKIRVAFFGEIDEGDSRSAALPEIVRLSPF